MTHFKCPRFASTNRNILVNWSRFLVDVVVAPLTVPENNLFNECAWYIYKYNMQVIKCRADESSHQSSLITLDYVIPIGSMQHHFILDVLFHISNWIWYAILPIQKHIFLVLSRHGFFLVHFFSVAGIIMKFLRINIIINIKQKIIAHSSI